MAVLQVLGGLVFCGLGALMMVFAGFMGTGGLIPDIPIFPAFVGGVVIGIIGGIMLVIGILGFAVAYGYWNGRGWAWTLGMVITVISLILDLLSLPEGALGLIINALIIYYLTRPYVKRWFGKKPVPFTV
jgi:multisubunit Na+/H+ antiporter MnhG subunit